MTKASDNVFPRLLISEGGSTATPAAGNVTQYAKADGLLYSKDDAGVETLLSSGPVGSVATDAIWDTKGDLAAATGADAAAKLAAAANGSFLRTASGQSTGLEWQLNNLAAAVAPAVTDDSGDGYSVGSRWIDTTADKEYVCLDATVGAAVWTETTGGGGSVSTDAIWDAKGDIAGGTGANTAARLAVGANDTVLTADSTAATGMKWAAAAAGGATDPVIALFGTPTTAYDFATSSLTGLTAMGTPDAEDADTTIPDAYYVERTANFDNWCGRYAASPSTPFTAFTKILDFTLRLNYTAGGLYIGVTTPGAFMGVNQARVDRYVDVEKWTNPSTISTQPATGTDKVSMPLWLALVVNSTTSVDFLYSLNGWLWVKLYSADPSLTIGSVGIGMNSSSVNKVAAAFDYLYLYDGALTLPGA